MTAENPVEQAQALLFEKGQRGLDRAREVVAKELIPDAALNEAVAFFMNSWKDVLHPAWLALSCESVGGKPEVTVDVAAAIVLLAGGADLHDDIIDQSPQKDAKQTVYHKFGKELTLLAGDALIVIGLYQLHEACKKFPLQQRQLILDMTKQAFFGISSAQAKENRLKRRTDCAQEYLEMIKIKAAVSEATMRIGGVIGGATSVQIDALGCYGRNIGILFTLRDEFIDMYELDELKNRWENECLPLPILLNLKNPKIAEKIKRLSNNLSVEQVETIANLVIDSKETTVLKKEMRLMVREAKTQLRNACIENDCFEILLKSMMEDI